MRVCVCVWTGLDADLLAVLPALSRHPSLKHLHLGKNFNIKNRCSQRHASLQCACRRACVCASLCAPATPTSRTPLPPKRLLAAGSDLTLPPLFVSLHRVLDEVLQKLVTLIQEEECVSEHPGNVHALLHTHTHTHADKKKRV